MEIPINTYVMLGVFVTQVVVLPILLIAAGCIATGRADGKAVTRVVLGLCLGEIFFGLFFGIWLAAKAIAGKGSENFAALALMLFGIAIFGVQLELSCAIGKLCRQAPSRGNTAMKGVAVVVVAITSVVVLGGLMARF